MTTLISIGRGGAIDLDHVVAVARASSAPVKRLLEAAGPARVLNLTYGEPRQSVILFDNGCLAVVSLAVEEVLATIARCEEPVKHVQDSISFKK